MTAPLEIINMLSNFDPLGLSILTDDEETCLHVLVKEGRSDVSVHATRVLLKRASLRSVRLTTHALRCLHVSYPTAHLTFLLSR